MISEVQNMENDYEYYRLLQKFSAFLKDGHTNIYPSREIWNLINNEFTEHKFLLSHIDEKAIITGINKSKKDELPIGTEIIRVNGLPTKEYLEKHVAPISSSTDYVLKEFAVKSMFSAPVGTTFQVDFKLPEGKIKKLDLTVSEVKSEEEMFPPSEKKELLEFR